MPEAAHDLRLDHRRVLGTANEVLLEQVVGDRGMHFDAGEQRVERRGHDLARAECGRSDEHDLVLEHSGGASGR